MPYCSKIFWRNKTWNRWLDKKAYTKSAQLAIANIQIITRINYTTIHLTAKYNELGNVINKVEKSMGKIEKIEYGDVIKVTAKVLQSEVNKFV